MAWRVPGYEPMSQLGRGSTGMVMSARDTTTGSVVAIKYLSSDVYRAPGFLDRYRDEIGVLDGIEHPHVAQVFEFAETAGAAAVVTELVSGVSLRQVIDVCGALDPQAALYVLKGALLGLGEAHGRSIVHRDVKPENLIIDGGGVTKVVDIGIVAPHRRAPATPRYLAPELWAGGPATPTTDVYAATAVLLECLTGRPPRSTNGKYLGLSKRPVDGAIAAIRPGELADRIRILLSRGLADQPSGRPSDADALLDELELAALSAYGRSWEVAGKANLARQMASPGRSGRARSAPARAIAGGTVATTATTTGTVTATPPTGIPRPRAISSEVAPTSPPVGTLPPVVIGRPPTSPQTGEPDEPNRRRTVLLVAVAVLLVLGAGTAFALTGAFSPDRTAGSSGPNFSHVPVAATGPTVPPRGSIGSGPDTTAPDPPAGLHITGRSQTAVTLDWSPAFDNIKVIGYIVNRDGKKIATSFQPGFTDSNLSPKTTHAYTVAAFDAAGNVSPVSAPVNATTLVAPDTLAPSVPAGLHSTGRSTTMIVLAWSASRDDVGVAGYDIVRDGQVVGSSSLTTYTDKGLTPNSTHTYTVRAYDTANNASDNGASLTVTTLATPDTMKPTVPTKVVARATGATTISVTWDPSHDNVGVTGYLVYRGPVQVATVANPAFTDSGLDPDTSYSYRIAATDAATNVSGLSAPASATTVPGPTPTPTPTPSPSPTPTPDPPTMTFTVDHTQIDSSCVTIVQATVTVSSGSMPVSGTYTFSNGESGPVAKDVSGTMTFDVGQPIAVSGPGTATVDLVGAAEQSTSWVAPPQCLPPPPTTDITGTTSASAAPTTTADAIDPVPTGPDPIGAGPDVAVPDTQTPGGPVTLA